MHTAYQPYIGCLKFPYLTDAFVPYCYLFPDRLVTKRVKATVYGAGQTILEPGDKHEIVIDIDYAHFEKFLLKNLRIKREQIKT